LFDDCFLDFWRKKRGPLTRRDTKSVLFPPISRGKNRGHLTRKDTQSVYFPNFSRKEPYEIGYFPDFSRKESWLLTRRDTKSAFFPPDFSRKEPWSFDADMAYAMAVLAWIDSRHHRRVRAKTEKAPLKPPNGIGCFLVVI
jgi:hypothetical protein